VGNCPRERRVMTYKFTIKGHLEGMNDYINACRTNPHKGNKMKRDAEEYISWPIRTQLRGANITKPVMLKYDFYEPNKKRDLDNVSGFAHKVIQDALVKCNILENDGWNNIVGYLDQFYCDRNNPRIEVTIVEVGD
jgi:Holliday junction resolvase RusA-like endonuclease